MKLRAILVAWWLISSPAAFAAEPAPQRKADDAAIEFYEKRVRPILAANCYECHGDDEQEAGLSTTSVAALLRGGDQGPAIVPGDPAASLLIQGIRYDDADFKMPPKAKLSNDQIQVLTQWVKDGALGPDESQQRIAGVNKKFNLAERAKHWCFQPLQETAPSVVRDAAWTRSPIDRFVLAKLEEKQLHPAADADPRTLIRRVYFDLIGLPPSVGEVEAFVRAEKMDDAYAAVVDTLLASPHFGERWGRHWLDLVRYAETRGHEFDPVIPNAYQYRDYVIRALNADVPYDQFVREHLAGDVLPRPRIDPATGANESILGTGFWWLGEEVHSPVDIRQDETDRVDNKIDVMSKTFLGLTLACARCHDHKFDALSTKDYYAFAGFAQSMSYRQAAFESDAHNRRIFEQVQQLEAEYWNRLTGGQWELWQPVMLQADKYFLAVHDVLEELQREGKKAKRAAVFTATANQFELDDERLDAWVKECERSRDGILAVLVRQLKGKESTLGLSEPAATAADPAPRIVYDPAKIEPRLWLHDGLVFGDEPAHAGDFRLGGDPTRLVERVFTKTAAVADRNWDVVQLGAAERDPCRVDWQQANRTLKTPTFTLETGKLAYYVRGSGQIYAEVASHRINRGPLHGKLVLNSPGSDEWRWVEHDLSAYVGQRIHLEFSPHDAKKLKPGQSPEFSLRGAIERPSDSGASSTWFFDPPTQPLTFESRFSADILKSAAEMLLDSNTRLPISGVKLAIVDWMLQHPEMFNTPNPSVAAGTAQYFARRSALLGKLRRTSATAPAAFEGTGVDEFVLVRGQHKTPGDLVPRRFLEAIDGPQQPEYTTVGGRLELADRLLDRRDPLPSRVMVNRVWYHLLGRGIVKSVDNFGIMGDAPTHPELLDHLAREFMTDGWSVKNLIRRIVLSSTYRQSSNTLAAGLAPRATRELDPNNDLLHRANIKRLDAEIIRDALLAVSGRLDRTTFGPSVEVYLTPFMEGRGRPGGNGPLDGAGRRSIYLRVRRNFLNPMFQAFDYPTPFTAIGKRTNSNVPAQALALLNGPLVSELAQSWANRVLGETTAFDSTRIERLYEEAFSRPPTAGELQAAEEFLAEQRRLYAAKDENDPQVWTDLCHVLFNVKEFIYIP